MKNDISRKWKIYELDAIVENLSSKFNPLKSCENKICIELEHISKEAGKIIGYTDSKSQLSIKNLFYKGQILFGKLRPYLRKYYKAEFNGVCSSEIWVLNGKKVCNEFLFYLVQSDKFAQIANVTTGSKMPRADWDYMKEIPFEIPPMREQEKIAEILSHADEMINQCERLIALKQKYKKGLMQRLFTPLDSIQDRIKPLRFKEFKDKWQIVRLGDMCEISTGSLNANAMCENGEYAFFTCAREVYRIDKYAFDTEALLISGNGNVGYIHYFCGKFNAYQRTYVLESFKGCNIIFVKYLLDEKLNLRIEKEKKAGNIPYIVLSTISDMAIPLPPLKEQEKIAAVLSLCDNEIALLKDKLNALKMQKKGLMQQLLSAQVRVKV